MFKLKSGAILGFVAVCSVTTGAEVGKRAFDVFDFVDPLIGTINGGVYEWLKNYSRISNDSRTCVPWRNPAFRYRHDPSFALGTTDRAKEWQRPLPTSTIQMRNKEGLLQTTLILLASRTCMILVQEGHVSP